MVHTHGISVYASGSDFHNHSGFSGVKNCGSGKSHSHPVINNNAGTHAHDFTLNCGDGDACTNYATHTHTCTIDGVADGGAAHSHTLTALTTATCANCTVGHSHTIGSVSCGNGGAAHSDHTGGSITSSAPLGGGTPANHQHYFIVVSGSGGSHGHTLSGNCTSATCQLSYSHNHTGGSLAASGHIHSFSGAGYLTNADGEVCSQMLRRLLVGVGL
jgi:hypothetical protein